MVEVKLCSFYLCFINRCFHFNAARVHYTLGLSPICTMCNEHNKIFMHVFWDCPKIQPLWLALIEWCKLKVDSTKDYPRVNCLIRGFGLPVLNMIMTICKYHIYLLKLFGGAFTFDFLLSRIAKIRTQDILMYHELPYLCITDIHKRWHPIENDIVV